MGRARRCVRVYSAVNAVDRGCDAAVDVVDRSNNDAPVFATYRKQCRPGAWALAAVRYMRAIKWTPSSSGQLPLDISVLHTIAHKHLSLRATSTPIPWFATPTPPPPPPSADADAVDAVCDDVAALRMQWSLAMRQGRVRQYPCQLDQWPEHLRSDEALHAQAGVVPFLKPTGAAGVASPAAAAAAALLTVESRMELYEVVRCTCERTCVLPPPGQ